MENWELQEPCWVDEGLTQEDIQRWRGFASREGDGSELERRPS